MGGGSYDYIASSHRSTTQYSHQSMEEIFRNDSLAPEMNIKGKVRESCDSEEHPESYPIIIGLDVTGSMGMVPQYLIQEAFPEIMKKILDAGVPNPQVCFMAFGDQNYDNYPIQVGQFESSDELMEKWLLATDIEEGGGGDGAESPNLVWYAAWMHTKTDSFEKRGKKGVIITISDEACHGEVTRNSIESRFGDLAEKGIPTTEVLNGVQEKWNVYHINLRSGYRGTSKRTIDWWTEHLGNHLVHTENPDGKDIIEIIPNLILQAYNNNDDLNVKIGD